MAWLYVPASAGSSSACTSSSETPITPSVTWRGKPLPPRHWSRAWKRVPWLRLLSGTTCTPSTADAGVARWISSLVAIHARERATPESVLDAMILGGCGRSSGGLLSAHARACASSRTSQLTFDALFGTSMRTFDGWATELRQEYSARRKWARRTREPGFSSWPTTTTRDHKGGADWNTRHRRGRPRRESDMTLADRVESVYWPTPTASDGTRTTHGIRGEANPTLPSAARSWSTPKASDTAGPKSPEQIRIMRERTGAGVRNLHEDAAEFSRSFRPDPMTATDGPVCSPSTPPSRLRLNPLFDEWLMALPRGWTDFAPVGTEYIRWLQRWRSYLYGADCVETTDPDCSTAG